jgi:hypothetical protein
MKNGRTILWLGLILLAGGMATAILDWRQEQRSTALSARKSAESMVGLLSLYPLSDADAGIRRLLVKSLIEHSATPVVYLIMEDTNGKRLLEYGDLSLILIRRQIETNDPWPTRKGTHVVRVVGEAFEPILQLPDHLVHVVHDAIRELLFAQFVPDVFLGIEFG